jgi:hypothetical protein
MQISLQASELLGNYVRELAAVAPNGWTKLIMYKELVRDSGGYLRNSALEEVRIGDKQVFELPGSVAAYNALERFFDFCSQSGDTWSAVRLEIEPDGRFASRFYYGQTPLMDGDYQTAEARIATSS